MTNITGESICTEHRRTYQGQDKMNLHGRQRQAPLRYRHSGSFRQISPKHHQERSYGRNIGDGQVFISMFGHPREERAAIEQSELPVNGLNRFAFVCKSGVSERCDHYGQFNLQQGAEGVIFVWRAFQGIEAARTNHAASVSARLSLAPPPLAAGLHGCQLLASLAHA